MGGLVLLIGGAEFALKGCIYLWNVRCHLVYKTLKAQGMKQYAVELDGIVLLIFVMYNVLSAGGYLAKKIGREIF